MYFFIKNFLRTFIDFISLKIVTKAKSFLSHYAQAVYKNSVH